MKFRIFLEAIELEYHDTLNPSLWRQEEDEYFLKDEINSKLTTIAEQWTKFAKIPKEAVMDIVLTGGNCNYNYTKYSDIDLHIVIDKEKLLPKQQWDMPFGHQTIVGEVINDYLKSKKQLWSLKHDIKVSGYPVEVYGQGSNEIYHEGQGVYSILQKKWISKPIHGNYNFDNKSLTNKFHTWQKRIDDAILSNSSEEVNNIRRRLSNMRKSSLERGGEFAPENLIFKALRNSGYLQKLSIHQHSIFDKSLSL
jgi:hypothetical protein